MGAPFQPGDVLDGKYVVERVIGKGGAGLVVAASHTVLKQRVALKFLHDELAAAPNVAQRFLREAETAAQLVGPHVARVMDADTLESGRPYIVMEYLEGQDLAALLKQTGPLPPSDAANYLLQASEAVAEAHALGIVHRDIKPANLFLTRDRAGRPLVKVLDFGLSKILHRDGPVAEGLTHSTQIFGSLHFMSPEQMRSSRDVDERTDIWSLGVTLYVLLTGRVPFKGKFIVEVGAAVLANSPPSLGSKFAPALAAVIGRCLRLDPAERYASVAEFARALAPFAVALPSPGEPAVSDAGRRDRAQSTPPSPAWIPVETGVAKSGGSGRVSRTMRYALIAVGGVAIAGLAFRVATSVAPRHAAAMAMPIAPSGNGTTPTSLANEPSAVDPVALPSAAPAVASVAQPLAQAPPVSPLVAPRSSKTVRTRSPAKARGHRVASDDDVIHDLPH